MQSVKCKKCGNTKEPREFYKNLKKANGLESHCKACVLARKAKKYSAVSKIKKKNKYLRLCKKVNVVDVEECTLNEVLINRPSSDIDHDLLKEIVSGILCYQDMEKSRELATAG